MTALAAGGTASTFSQRMAELRAQMAARPPLLTQPALASRTLGWSVRSATRTDAAGASVGGVVVEITEGHDAETGEAFRRYLTVERFRSRLAWHVIAEDDVGEAHPPDAGFVSDTVRALLGEVAMLGCRPRTGRIGDLHRTYVAYAYHLVGVL